MLGQVSVPKACDCKQQMIMYLTYILYFSVKLFLEYLHALQKCPLARIRYRQGTPTEIIMTFRRIYHLINMM